MRNRHFSKMTDAELAQVIVDANLVQEAVEHPGFVRLVLPVLTERFQAASSASDWKPGDTYEVAKVALCNAYNSGRKSALCETATIFQGFQADKVEVLKELSRRKAGEKK